MLPTVDEVYVGKNLKAADVITPRLLTVATVTLEEFPTDDGGTVRKFVLHFEEESRGLVCAQVNARMIQKYYGTHPEKWVGKQIVLYKADVEFKGKIVDAIRVRMPKGGIKKNPNITTGKALLTPPEAENPGDGVDDEIPF